MEYTHIVVKINREGLTESLCKQSLDWQYDNFVAIKSKSKTHKINTNNPSICPLCKLEYVKENK